MRLVGAEGEVFVLDVTGYEFPTNTSPPGYDWLEVEGRVCDGINTWDIEDALLTCTDLTGLAGWVTALSRGELDPERHFAFSEPASIWMDMPAPSTIRVGFGGAGLEWNGDGPQPARPDPLEFLLDETQLGTLVDDIVAASLAFPERPSDWVPGARSMTVGSIVARPQRSWAELIRLLFTGR
jgi:hypothetical protein